MNAAARIMFAGLLVVGGGWSLAAERGGPRGFEGLEMPKGVTGGRSVFRGVEIHGMGKVASAPVIISGHGGGLWYNFRDGSARLLIDRPAGGVELKLPALERPVVYLRGSPG